MRMNAKVKRILQWEIRRVLKPTYFACIPFDEIERVVEAEGFAILQEDRTKWSGLLCGSEAQVYFSLGGSPNEEGMYQEVNNGMLALSWYQMSSGRYEVIGYIT